MQDTFHVRSGPPSGGFVTIGTMILAAASAVLLVLLSGCHSTPPASGFVSSGADKATEARLRRPDTMPPLQPFDEQFVVATDAAN
jgi:hypothetical protein